MSCFIGGSLLPGFGDKSFRPNLLILEKNSYGIRLS